MTIFLVNIANIQASLSLCVSVSLCFGLKTKSTGLPWWLSGKELPANAGDMGSIPGLEIVRVLRDNRAHAPQLLSQSSRALVPQQKKLLQ